MKKILAIVLVMLLGMSNLYAKDKSTTKQSPPLKIGYVNFEYIVGNFPGIEALQSEFLSLNKQLEKHITAKLEDCRKKEQAFQKEAKNMTESIRKQKALELQQLRKSIQQLQEESSKKLTSKQESLFSPVLVKIRDAVAQVAQDHGYTYVLNATVSVMGILLYGSEEHEVSNLVLRKLGVDVDKLGDEKK
ncbi:MAG: OmpH/Skp family outer membrane protein [Bacteroidota bacterium]